MPPKQSKNEPSKKTQEKQKQKVIEDKTFGLKNKKGAKQQKFVSQVQKQVTLGGKSAREIELAKVEKEAKKEQKKKELEELNALFRPVTDLQKLPKGVDPKSVLCVYYKQGKCAKGDKCKFSHDLAIARKTEKKSLYDCENDEKKDSMEGWSQQELEDVVRKKHEEQEKSLPPTAIICKYFLDAVEQQKYGWFWDCPNGPKCHYRHALPPGFVLKRDQKKMEEQKDKISLEELIEQERTSLAAASAQTPVTLESFLMWKKRKRSEKISKMDQEKAKRRADLAAGRSTGISGREMFEFRPELQIDLDDEDEGQAWDFKNRETDQDEENVHVHEIRFGEYGDFEIKNDLTNGDPTPADGATSSQKQDLLDEAAACSSSTVSKSHGLVIDEDLFAGGDDELDTIDQELETLDLTA